MGGRDNILTSSVPSVSTSTGREFVSDFKSAWATQGIFGRFQYNYKEKYLVEFNGRYDGSSKFEKGSRWGFFPSVSVGYEMANEDYWSSLRPFIESFKLRGSG